MKASQVLDSSQPDTQYAAQSYGKVEPTVTVNFRFCQPGEAYLKTGECQECPSNTYLFDSVNEPTDCLLCPRNALCFGGDKVGPVAGFWRSHSKSLEFLSCFNPAACFGSQEEDYDPKGSCEANY